MLRGVSLVVVAVLAFGASGAAALYVRFQSNIDSIDVSDLVAPLPVADGATTPDPQDGDSGRAINILLMGSDERDGENAAIGGDVAGMRSDTTIVAHISADRQRVDLVSIPRDSLVDIPSCTMSDGSTSSAKKNQMFNSAFAIGADQGGDTASAAACTINTVQANTGVAIDYFVVVDFAGFVKMVDSVGGVPICVANDMDSPLAGLHVKAGYQTLDGTTALAFARARKGTGVGDGSDTNRLGRQQELMSAMISQVFSKNLLTDTTQLIRFLDAATESLSIDSKISSITSMTGLAYSLRNTPTGNITFMTIPFAAAPSDPNRVVWTSAAAGIWANMAADQPLLTEETPAATTPPADTATTDPGTTTDPVAPDTGVPTPTETKTPGKEAFTVDDTTAVC